MLPATFAGSSGTKTAVYSWLPTAAVRGTVPIATPSTTGTRATTTLPSRNSTVPEGRCPLSCRTPATSSVGNQRPSSCTFAEATRAVRVVACATVTVTGSDCEASTPGPVNRAITW